MSQSFQLAVVHAGTSEAASTKLLADRLAESVSQQAAQESDEIEVSVVSLKELATEISTAIVSGLLGAQLESAQQTLLHADGIIAASPIYKAEASGLFSSFFHVIDRDLLIGKPVLLAATAGTARHSLVLDHQMRALFAYMRTLTTPTSVFAAPEDWNEKGLQKRIDRSARELQVLMSLKFSQILQGDTWDTYQHDFGGAGGSNQNVDLETDLMKLATGGSLR
jgi:FMN reductase